MSKQGTSVVKCLKCRTIKSEGSICRCQSKVHLGTSGPRCPRCHAVVSGCVCLDNSNSTFTGERMNQVTQVNKIDAFQVEGIINAKTGDILIHHSGRRYFVNSVSNLQDTQKFPKTITYVEFNKVDGEAYSRPSKELVRTMFNTSYHGERVNA